MTLLLVSFKIDGILSSLTSLRCVLNDYNGVCLNSTFIALVQKKKRLVKVFHPISLVSSVYKIFKKVLASRLSRILFDTFPHNQSPFPGRQIFYASLIAIEVVDEVRSQRKQGVVFNLDFEKAYDCINWFFLDKVMDWKGFR